MAVANVFCFNSHCKSRSYLFTAVVCIFSAELVLRREVPTRRQVQLAIGLLRFSRALRRSSKCDFRQQGLLATTFPSSFAWKYWLLLWLFAFIVVVVIVAFSVDALCSRSRFEKKTLSRAPWTVWSCRFSRSFSTRECVAAYWNKVKENHQQLKWWDSQTNIINRRTFSAT